MSKTHTQGFTLIELMAVLIIIGVVCAIAVPGIVEVRYRNILTESVNNIQMAAVQARTLALQTRNAVTLEVRGDRVWVNLLSGTLCSSTIARNCITNTGTIGGGEVLIYGGAGEFSLAREAGVAMCLGAARHLTDIGTGNDPLTDTDCPAIATVLPSTAPDIGFALCYSGKGELRVRRGIDVATECSASAPDAGPGGATWLRTCSASDVAAMVDQDLKLYDGAVIVFNRYEDANCDEVREGVRRALFLPTTGTPFSRLAP